MVSPEVPPDAVWAPVESYPGYEVSDYGHVRDSSGYHLSQSLVTGNNVRVNLLRNGVRTSVLVHTIVAHAFIPHYDVADRGVIHLDGDQTNCRVDNLAWRPKWFCWKYRVQFNSPLAWPDHELVDVISQRKYSGYWDVVRTHGLLLEDIRRCVLNPDAVHTCFPTSQRFAHAQPLP